MSNALNMEVSISIKADISIVWDALINPDVIREYFFGTEAVSTWEVGEPILFRGIWDEKPYEDKGIILKSQKEKEFQYTYWSSFSGTTDAPENYATITYKLSSQGKETMLTVTQTGFKTEEQREHSKQNWTMVLENLKSILEG